MKLVSATANPDKVVEINAILGGLVELVPRPPDVPDVVEDGDTLEANARLKAVAIVEATGQAAVADDTGLEVDALDGAPGVYSGRFAGENATYAENVAKMLSSLADVADADRTARFRTVALVRWPDGEEVISEGVVEGRIARSVTAGEGWGYDPIFIADEADGRSFAEIGPDGKNAISHRGRAFRALLEALARHPRASAAGEAS